MLTRYNFDIQYYDQTDTVLLFFEYPMRADIYSEFNSPDQLTVSEMAKP